MEELLTQKNDAIQRATTGNMPQAIIDEITKYFDEYINAGFVTTVNGKAGQLLKVFADYCIVFTKSEGKKEELESSFHEFDDDYDDDYDYDDDDDAILSSADKKHLASGLLSGRIVQAGVGAAVTAVLNSQEKEKREEQRAKEQRHKEQQYKKKIGKIIVVGEKRISLGKITDVELFTKKDVSNGYLKFVPKGVASANLYNCEYFFFKNSIPFESKKIKQRLEAIKNDINQKIANAEIEAKKAKEIAAQKKAEKEKVAQEEQVRRMVEQATQQNKADVFEEVRKYKQLLDEGIITAEEFAAKKKELLGL